MRRILNVDSREPVAICNDNPNVSGERRGSVCNEYPILRVVICLISNSVKPGTPLAANPFPPLEFAKLNSTKAPVVDDVFRYTPSPLAPETQSLKISYEALSLPEMEIDEVFQPAKTYGLKPVPLPKTMPFAAVNPELSVIEIAAWDSPWTKKEDERFA